MDDDLTRILEAHVRYEVDRWQDDAVHATVAEAVSAGFDWLEAVTLRALVPADDAGAWIRRVVVDEPLTDDLFEELAWALRAAHESLLTETDPLADVLPRERYEQWISSAVGLQRLRREVISQVTQSTVYAELVSHVLYHGVKNYLLTENAVVRHIPGASSLVRMGQNAVRSATPSLEAGIDRRLVAFVAANVAETVRDSRAFLNEVLDDAMLRTIADEIWAVNSPRAVGEITALVEEETLDGLASAGWDTCLGVRRSPAVAHLIDALVEQFYQAHGDEPVAEIITGLGVTREAATEGLGAVAARLLVEARAGGHLEAYVRRRLEAFYSSYASGSSAGTASAGQAT